MKKSRNNRVNPTELISDNRKTSIELSVYNSSSGQNLKQPKKQRKLSLNFIKKNKMSLCILVTNVVLIILLVVAIIMLIIFFSKQSSENNSVFQETTPKFISSTLALILTSTRTMPTIANSTRLTTTTQYLAQSKTTSTSTSNTASALISFASQTTLYTYASTSSSLSDTFDTTQDELKRTSTYSYYDAWVPFTLLFSTKG